MKHEPEEGEVLDSEEETSHKKKKNKKKNMKKKSYPANVSEEDSESEFEDERKTAKKQMKVKKEKLDSPKDETMSLEDKVATLNPKQLKRYLKQLEKIKADHEKKKLKDHLAKRLKDVKKPAAVTEYPKMIKDKKAFYYCLICSQNVGVLKKWNIHKRTQYHMESFDTANEEAKQKYNCQDIDLQECAITTKKKLKGTVVGQCRDCSKVFKNDTDCPEHLQTGVCPDKDKLVVSSDESVKDIEDDRRKESRKSRSRETKMRRNQKEDKSSSPRRVSRRRSNSPESSERIITMVQDEDVRKVRKLSRTPDRNAGRETPERHRGDEFRFVHQAPVVPWPKYMLNGKQAYYFCNMCKIPIGTVMHWNQHVKSQEHKENYASDPRDMNEKNVNEFIVSSCITLSNYRNHCLACDIYLEDTNSFNQHINDSAHAECEIRMEINDGNDLRLGGERFSNFYFCELCDEVFSTIPKTHKLSEKHVLLVQNTEQCYFCPKRYIPTMLVAHIDEYHVSHVFNCLKCSVKFISSDKMLSHARTHLTDVQRRLYTDMDVVKLGIFKVPRDLRKIECKGCDSACFLAQDVHEPNSHVLAEHDHVSFKDIPFCLSFGCRICPDIFQSEMEMNSHVDFHLLDLNLAPLNDAVKLMLTKEPSLSPVIIRHDEIYSPERDSYFGRSRSRSKCRGPQESKTRPFGGNQRERSNSVNKRSKRSHNSRERRDRTPETRVRRRDKTPESRNRKRDRSPDRRKEESLRESRKRRTNAQERKKEYSPEEIRRKRTTENRITRIDRSPEIKERGRNKSSESKGDSRKHSNSENLPSRNERNEQMSPPKRSYDRSSSRTGAEEPMSQATPEPSEKRIRMADKINNLVRKRLKETVTSSKDSPKSNSSRVDRRERDRSPGLEPVSLRRSRSRSREVRLRSLSPSKKSPKKFKMSIGSGSVSIQKKIRDQIEKNQNLEALHKPSFKMDIKDRLGRRDQPSLEEIPIPAPYPPMHGYHKPEIPKPVSYQPLSEIPAPMGPYPTPQVYHEPMGQYPMPQVYHEPITPIKSRVGPRPPKLAPDQVPIGSANLVPVGMKPPSYGLSTHNLIQGGLKQSTYKEPTLSVHSRVGHKSESSNEPENPNLVPIGGKPYAPPGMYAFPPPTASHPYHASQPAKIVKKKTKKTKQQKAKEDEQNEIDESILQIKLKQKAKEDEANLLNKLKQQANDDDLRKVIEEKKVKMLDSRPDGIKVEKTSSSIPDNEMCPLCWSMFKDLDELLKHMKSSHMSNMFGCKLCKAVGWSMEILFKHITETHDKSATMSEALHKMKVPESLERINCKMCPPPYQLGQEGLWLCADLTSIKSEVDIHFNYAHNITDQVKLTSLVIICIFFSYFWNTFCHNVMNFDFGCYNSSQIKFLKEVSLQNKCNVNYNSYRKK